ncbi:hypothetical protein M5D96_003694, partial [Drosophila gunungcola]
MGQIVWACLLIVTVVNVHGYRKYGRNCRDISCAPGQKCNITKKPCTESNQLGDQCGEYPTCQITEKNSLVSGDFLKRRKRQANQQGYGMGGSGKGRGQNGNGMRENVMGAMGGQNGNGMGSQNGYGMRGN